MVTVLGIGKNKSKLTKTDCIKILYNPFINIEKLSSEDLDTLYFYIKGYWAYHLPIKFYIEEINNYRNNNIIC